MSLFHCFFFFLGRRRILPCFSSPDTYGQTIELAFFHQDMLLVHNGTFKKVIVVTSLMIVESLLLYILSKCWE